MNHNEEWEEILLEVEAVKVNTEEKLKYVSWLMENRDMLMKVADQTYKLQIQPLEEEISKLKTENSFLKNKIDNFRGGANENCK